MNYSCVARNNNLNSSKLKIIDTSYLNLIASDNSSFYPTFSIKLSANDVHLWQLNIEQFDAHIMRLKSTISENERRKAASFRFEKHKKRYVIVHGVLRIILSFYLNIKPNQIDFSYGPFGKPFLGDELSKNKTQFNLSHSHNIAFYVFTKKRRIGIDLEYEAHLQRDVMQM